MRDIEDYQKVYAIESFEEYKVKYRRKMVLGWLEKYKPERILEIGCGMEPLFKYIGFDYTKYVFFEPGETFYRNAMKYANNDTRIVGINACFEGKKQIENETFDMIICSGLLHEVENPKQMISDIVDVANLDSIIHINTPNANSMHRLLGKAMGIIHNEKDFSARNIELQQHSVFDITELAKLVEDANLAIIESGDYFIKPFNHDQMHQMISKGIIDDTVLDGLYLLSKSIQGVGSEIFINCRKKS